MQSSQYNPLQGSQHLVDETELGVQVDSDVQFSQAQPSEDGSPTTLFAARDAGHDMLTATAEAIAGAVAPSRSGSFAEPAGVFRWNALANMQFQPDQVLAGLLFLGAQGLYLTSSAQPSLNAWTAFEWLFANNECDVGEPDCYMQWDGPISLLVYFFVFCTAYANYRISLEFMPSTFKAIKSMGQSAWNSLKLFLKWCGFDVKAKQKNLNMASVMLLVAAVLLAGSGATVTFELGKESLVLFKADLAWLNTVLLVTAVGSTLSTRFISCRAMLHIFYQRLLAYSYADVPLRWLGYKEAADFYENRRWLLAGMFDLYFNEYRLPEAVWTRISGQINSGQILQAFTTLYHPSTNLNVEWPGLLAYTNANKLTQSFYNATLFVCYFFAIAAYPIIYNITAKSFAEWKPWATLSYGIVLASTLFYIYAIGRLPDQIARGITMSSLLAREGTPYSRWSMFTWSFLIGFISCGNFLYSGLAQAKEGSFDYLGLTRDQAKILFAIVGGVISGGCNLYAVLSIDERHAVPKRYKTSGDTFTACTKSIETNSSDLELKQAQAAEVIKRARSALSWCGTFAPVADLGQSTLLLGSGDENRPSQC